MAITILHWNASSIFKKLPELKQYLAAGHTALPDVICIQETHLTPKYHPVFPNYTILRQDRPPFRGKGGGLLICIKTSLEFSEVICLARALVWKSSGSPWVGMRSSTSIIHPLTTCKRKILFFSRFRNVVLCGDFNAHHGVWGSLSASHNGRLLLSVLETHDFVVLNTLFLPITPLVDEWSVLDLSIVSADIASVCNATVHNEFIETDHSIVQIAIRCSDAPNKTHIPRWNFQRANWQRFSDLCDLSLPSISMELEQSYQLCETSILQAATASIPQTKYSEKLSVPWWNAGCDRAIKNKACFQSHESYKIAN